MARRVVSLIRGVPGILRTIEPSLEANAYAVAEDVDLTVVLRGSGVDLAVAGGEVAPADLAGVRLPAAASAHDLRLLLESGVAVYACSDALARRGLDGGDLVAGVQVTDNAGIAKLLRDAEAVLSW